MKLIITGLIIIVLGYAWLIFNAVVGYTNAWWWFRWSDFKFILAGFHLVGAVIIGLGVKQRSKPRRAS